MGQYYHPTNINKMEGLSAHDFNNGLKLMEHSWLKNDMVKFVEYLLSEGMPWYKCRLVWAGDYADEPEELINNKSIYEQSDTDWDWENLYKESKESNIEIRFIVNETKKIYIDKKDLKESEDGWIIHPLPLLTAMGNGRGGGDFNKEDSRVGLWAKDIIFTTNNLKDIPEDYIKEDEPSFFE